MLKADNPWKEVCERKLPAVFDLLFPTLVPLVDWTADTETLDQELRKLAPTSVTGGRIADRLIKALAVGSADPRFFLVEVQGKKERHFRRRIHQGNLRAEERVGGHITSLVVLTDADAEWMSSRYVSGTVAIPRREGSKGRQRYRDERTLRWILVKLIDFRERQEELEEMENPMGLFVMAHLEGIRTRKKEGERQQAKLRLLLNLRSRKMEEEESRFWLTCFDWFLQLPAEREAAIRAELQRLDKEENVPYVSWLERAATERGVEQGIEKGIEKGMRKGTGKTLASYVGRRMGDEAARRILAMTEGMSEIALEELTQTIFDADEAGLRALLFHRLLPILLRRIRFRDV